MTKVVVPESLGRNESIAEGLAAQGIEIVRGAGVEARRRAEVDAGGD